MRIRLLLTGLAIVCCVLWITFSMWLLLNTEPENYSFGNMLQFVFGLANFIAAIFGTFGAFLWIWDKS